MLTVLAVGLLVAVHLFAGRTGIFERHFKQWKSVAGGVGISYAFLVLLTKIASAQRSLEASTRGGIYEYLEHHAYLAALCGLVLYYGFDVAVERVLVAPTRRPWKRAVTALVVVHACGSSGYFFLVGYLLGEIPRDEPVSLALFTLAMAIHFIAVDHALLEKYGGLFDRVLRLVFTIATVLGAVLASTTVIPSGTYALLISLFAGMLIMATVKEELPGNEDARFWPFLAGVVMYSTLLLLSERLGS